MASSAAAATQRYASPTGSGTACTAAAPCSVAQSIGGAVAGDEVIISPGDYSLTATVFDPAEITIHGVAGMPRPRLMFSGPNQSGLLTSHHSLLRYLEIDQAATNRAALTAVQARMDELIVRGSGGVTAEIDSGEVRDSVVVNTATGGQALSTESWVGANETSASTYRNVTAIATGSGGVAIAAIAGFDTGPNIATVDATNVIARGGPGGAGLRAFTDSSGSQATITVTNSNYGSPSVSGTNTAIVNGPGNQAAFPSFVNAASGDYREAAGSPTIDAGLTQPINGAFDFEGDPRSIGTTDIGADEFVFPPNATTLPAAEVDTGSASLSGSVDPRGVVTTYHFEYGTTTAYGMATPEAGVPSSTQTRPATAALSGLIPGTTYHFRIVATNSGGTANGADQTFTTTTTPPSTTPPPTVPPASPPTIQSFAGVKLVSTKLSYARGIITLTLRCPSATTGRCSGRTTLRGRKAGGRKASSVIVGRASFSIRPGARATIKLRVSRPGRRRMAASHGVAATDTNTARDSAGHSKTTVTAVTIRRRR